MFKHGTLWRLTHFWSQPQVATRGNAGFCTLSSSGCFLEIWHCQAARPSTGISSTDRVPYRLLSKLFALLWLKQTHVPWKQNSQLNQAFCLLLLHLLITNRWIVAATLNEKIQLPLSIKLYFLRREEGVRLFTSSWATATSPHLTNRGFNVEQSFASKH